MNVVRAARHLAAAICILSLAGACSTLEPVDLPPEFAHAPADGELWRELAALRRGDWQLPLNAGIEALDWRLRAIDSATDSIDLQTFLWDLDVVGTMMLDHLVTAADRGVRVRILIDDTFLADEDRLLLALNRHPNIEYRIYNPFERRAGGMVTRQILNLAEFRRLDHRMHNKAMVVDGRVAIVGGRNLGDEYFGLHDNANFRDLELLLGGPVVTDVEAEFDDYWNDRWSFPVDRLTHVEPDVVALEELRSMARKDASLHREEAAEALRATWRRAVAAAFGGSPTLFADDPPRDRPEAPEDRPDQVADALIRLFDAAESSIVIVSAYLIPTPRLEGAIARAVQHGVDVRILTNSIRSNNHLAAHSAYRNHIRTLMEHGADLHEVRIDAETRARYMVSPVDEKLLALHAKTLLIDDDEVFVGSINLDPRSLRINTEMGVLVVDKALNAELRRQIEPDFSLGSAWHLQFDERGRVTWVADDRILTSQPSASFMQRIEDWLFAHLPVEGEL
ncbi:MAG: phospholipase D family protein [Woeseiaceae bacterium]|nr:phospholipase D family protein [Woeseiaceae bacterium]